MAKLAVYTALGPHDTVCPQLLLCHAVCAAPAHHASPYRAACCAALICSVMHVLHHGRGVLALRMPAPLPAWWPSLHADVPPQPLEAARRFAAADHRRYSCPQSLC